MKWHISTKRIYSTGVPTTSTMVASSAEDRLESHLFSPKNVKSSTSNRNPNGLSWALVIIALRVRVRVWLVYLLLVHYYVLLICLI